MNAADTIRALVIDGGSVELKRELAKQANEQLGEAEDTKSKVENEMESVSGMYRMSMIQAGGTITEEMKKMAKHLDYLKVMKKVRPNG